MSTLLQSRKGTKMVRNLNPKCLNEEFSFNARNICIFNRFNHFRKILYQGKER